MARTSVVDNEEKPQDPPAEETQATTNQALGLVPDPPDVPVPDPLVATPESLAQARDQARAASQEQFRAATAKSPDVTLPPPEGVTPLDETVPGGRYLHRGKWVNANGHLLKEQSEDSTSSETVDPRHRIVGPPVEDGEL